MRTQEVLSFLHGAHPATCDGPVLLNRSLAIASRRFLPEHRLKRPDHRLDLPAAKPRRARARGTPSRIQNPLPPTLGDYPGSHMLHRPARAIPLVANPATCVPICVLRRSRPFLWERAHHVCLICSCPGGAVLPSIHWMHREFICSIMFCALEKTSVVPSTQTKSDPSQISARPATPCECVRPAPKRRTRPLYWRSEPSTLSLFCSSSSCRALQRNLPRAHKLSRRMQPRPGNIRRS